MSLLFAFCESTLLRHGVACKQALTARRRHDVSCVSLGDFRAIEFLGKPLQPRSHVPRCIANIENVLNWS